MRIILNISPHDQPRGMAITLEELLKCWLNIGKDHEFILLSDNDADETIGYLEKRKIKCNLSQNFKYFYAHEIFEHIENLDEYFENILMGTFQGSLNSNKWLEKIKIDQFVRSIPDIALHPFHLSMHLAGFPCKHLPIIYDCIPLKYPELCEPLWTRHHEIMRKWVTSHCNNIITTSQSSKEDLKSLYGFTEDQIKVIPLAGRKMPILGNEKTRREILLSKAGVHGPYVMATSTRNPHKNFEGLCLAWQEIRNDPQFKQYALLLTGSNVESFGMQSGIHYIEYPSDEDLFCLLRGAELFISPSFAEGFGLPVLEAMGCGTPVCASNTTSLPEVIGNAGKFFDPYSIKSISLSIADMLTECSSQPDIWRRKALIRSAEFSWEETATQVLAALQECIEADI